ITGRDHDPNRARLAQLTDEIVKRTRSGSAFTGELLHVVSAQIEDDALVPAAHQATHHVRSHSTQTNHSQLHLSFPHRFPLRLSVSSVVNQFLTTENTEEHRE